ncbi:MAG: helix-turn-helix domain-containing protein [Eubacteriales bacterium]
MKENMGAIIKRLRKERNLTQEELAEMLNISSQSVSKWENQTSMPDISQIVPLANLFGVSTDVLFGMAKTNDREEVWKIIRNAQSLLTRPLDCGGLTKKYHALQEGLKLYPNNTLLLMECLETGLALAYPENEVYDPEHGDAIYRECVREGNLLLSNSTEINDLLRTHMILVLLHAAYGNFAQAKVHAEQFPCRADLNIHKMYAYLAHWQKDTEMEAANCQYGLLYLMEAIINMLTHLGNAYIALEKYDDAAVAFESALNVIGIFFGKEEVLPPFHHRENGDIYVMLADSYLKGGRPDDALSCLEKMTAYDIEECAKFSKDLKVKSPLLRDVKFEFYRLYIDKWQKLKTKLTDDRFAALREVPRYRHLLKKAESLGENI